VSELGGSSATAHGGESLPKNSTILIIRHAEKPPGGVGLAPAGRARALAYVKYFQDFSRAGTSPLTIDYIFAARNSTESCRPQLTILPTAAALDLPIDDRTEDARYVDVANQIRSGGAYDGSTLLICWHHEHALALADALAGEKLAKTLPASAAWPSRWPGGPPPPGAPDVYGWVLIIVSDADGKIDRAQSKCINEHLMPDDEGQDPPTGTA
jgi:hypothetical protein